MKALLFFIGLIVVIASLALAFSSKPAPKEVVNLNESTTSGQTQGSQTKKYDKFPGVLAAEQLNNRVANIKTAKGTIVIQLFAEAPKATSNFIFLTKENFYNGLTFHRREEGFVIQGGDPSGDGSGGPGYNFEDEPVARDYKRGIVAMANAGPNTNGSQFFIMLADTPLPKNYTIFGQVSSGLEVVDQIKVGDKMEEVTLN